MIAAFLAASCLLSANPVAEKGERVSIVEVNHVIDSQGNDRFTQLLYRDSNGLLRDWRYLQGPAMVPERGVAIWQEANKWRIVYADRVYETWTRHDPEREEARWMPRKTRRRLFGEPNQQWEEDEEAECCE